MKTYFLLFFSFCSIWLQAQITETPLPDKFKEFEKYNSAQRFEFGTVTVYAICTGYISTDKEFPEPVFVWLVKTPEENYLIDAGLAPGINQPGYFKGISKSFFEKKFDFYLYKENDLLVQLEKIEPGIKLAAVILTHAHFDHIGYLPKLKPGCVILSEEEKKQAQVYGQAAGYEKNTWEIISANTIKALPLDKYKSAEIGKYLIALRTDEHTKGHLMILLVAGKEKILFSGDLDISSLNQKNDLYNFLDKAYNMKSLTVFFNHTKNLKK